MALKRREEAAKLCLRHGAQCLRSKFGVEYRKEKLGEED
jgi:hypothetical protein